MSGGSAILSRWPPMSDGYEYGTRSDELKHGGRELQQLQLGLTDGVLSQDGYEDAAERVRDEYGIRPWGRPE